ncbi:glycosyltransferase family 4 protein [Dactylosporangium sp. CA-092794]|uniref:glycosyltransferase family 4 protein n=1 Tax=Dactylosporangium sp. CA-092794 TaxID=3239929 RepID=UPI003D8E67DE
MRRHDTTPALVTELRQLLPNVEVEDFRATPYRLNRLGALGRFPEASFEGMPPWIRSRYSQPLHERLIGSSGAGIAIGEAAGAYFRDTMLRWHWDKANVLAASTRQDVAEAPGAAHRLRAQYLARVSGRFEADALGRVSTVSVTSADESDRLLAHHGRAADFTLPSCVTVPTGYTPQPQPGRLVWLSSFSYRPNLLGLLRFLDESWATVRQAGYTLTLIGSGLSDAMRAGLAKYEGVEVLGYVEDLRPVLSTARAAVVPLWSGAGVKLKTLTLLSHSIPVFSTAVGAEGVPATPAVRIAETPAALADGIVSTTAEEYDRMAAEALRVVREHFSEEYFAGHLIRSLTETGYLGSAGAPVHGYR